MWTTWWGRPELPLTSCLILWQEQCWDVTWAKAVSTEATSLAQKAPEHKPLRVVRRRNHHYSSQPVLILGNHSWKQDTGLDGPLQPILGPSTPSVEVPVFLPRQMSCFHWLWTSKSPHFQAWGQLWPTPTLCTAPTHPGLQEKLCVKKTTWR